MDGARDAYAGSRVVEACGTGTMEQIGSQREAVTLANERAQLRLALEAECALRREIEGGWVRSELERTRLGRELERARAHCAALNSRVEEMNRTLRASQKVQEELVLARDEAARLQARLAAIQTSRFWRYTLGLRTLCHRAKRIRLDGRHAFKRHLRTSNGEPTLRR